MKIKDSLVRVHISKECWDSGLLRPFFEDVLPKEDVAMYFRVTNCDWDPDANCYVFKIPFLVGDRDADVYIPREYVRGMSVQHDNKASTEDMQQIGFQPKTKAAGA
jgi:hypothetical protein